MALEFEWDPRKAAANLTKHKVAFEEAATASVTRRAALWRIRDIRSARNASYCCVSPEKAVCLPLCTWVEDGKSASSARE